ncbi:hypothetical protein ACJW30_10G175900 [Castanea mollissima]
MPGNWEEVITIYEKYFESAYSVRINQSEDTALHFAISYGQDLIVEKLVKIICDKNKEVLKLENKEKNTPLHMAASMGTLNMCICIAKADPSLGIARNKDGETPLFLAALHGEREIFLQLHSICRCKLNDSYYRKNSGETILQCAIKRECWDLAYKILRLHEELANSVDEEGIGPLNLLAKKPSAFRSGCYLGWWNSIIYYCTTTDVPKEIDTTLLNKFPKNYQTCINFIQFLYNMVRAVFTGGRLYNKGKKADEENPKGSVYVTPKSSQEGISQTESEDRNSVRAKSGSLGFEEIKKIKEKHLFSAAILKFVVESIKLEQFFEHGRDPALTPYKTDELDFGNIPEEEPTDGEKGSNPQPESKNESPSKTNKPDESDSEKGSSLPLKLKYESPLLTAVKNGIMEMVKEILNRFPMAIHATSEEKNIILVAVENRQPQIYQILSKSKLRANLRTNSMFQACDKDNNNVLHLAAKLEEHQSWLIPGAALQMQSEIKWYELVKSTVPKYLLCQTNNDNKTPADIFTENHKDLVKEGGEWLNKTSESCSVVAALIATVAFATSTTVPGGVKENSGTPILESHPAFDVFAVTSLVALCFSVTALFLFLSILTSRYQEKDFRVDLPRKLLLGLTSLFVSIAAMLISFCAGHFFVLKDKLKDRALPVYVVTCLPITFYAISQFPLYFDLVRAHFKKVPRPSHTMVSL